MSVVWLLEAPRQIEESLLYTLVGDFPVRAFASIRNFLRIASTSTSGPKVCLLRAVDFEDDLDNFLLVFHLKWPSSRLLLVGVEGEKLPGVSGVEYLQVKNLHEIAFYLMRSESSRDEKSHFVHLGDVVLDVESARLKLTSQADWLYLTPKESQLLKVLLKNPESCMSHQDLSELVWKGVKVSPRSLASHISRVRKYLSGSSIQIQNVYGGGYQLTLHSSDM